MGLLADVPNNICAGRFSLLVVLLAAQLWGDPVPARYPLGSAHGFLALKTLAGVRIATGDLTQTVRKDRVTSRVIFRFKDGSVDDETSVFSQLGEFRLISDHHVQQGPSFPRPIDLRIDATSGLVISKGKDGKYRQDRLDLPSDLCNGLYPNLLMSIPASVPETKLSFVTPTEKPRLVHISIKPAGELRFTIGGTKRSATDYVLHYELGGLTGAVAPIVGKQPTDCHIWILRDPAPAFVRGECQLSENGPVWRIEQISPLLPN